MNDATFAPIDSEEERNNSDRRKLATWIERQIGGTVLRMERLSRWRPVWRADLQVGGRVKPLLIKGERTWNILPYSLEYEARMMMVLKECGIEQVPRVYGVCEDPLAFVMDFVEGERNTDLMRTTSSQSSLLSDERKAASLEYIDILVRMHAIDPDKFVEAGATRPFSPRDIALANAERYAALATDAGIWDPSLTFAYAWIRRNVPEHRSRSAFLTGDCGQFLNQGARVSAILDMEMGHLGDPLHDLACLRGRHPVEDLGDISALFDRYAATSGEPIDVPVLAYHTAVFHTLSLCAAQLLLQERATGGSWVEAAMQVNFIGRRGMEAIADILAVRLDDVEFPSQPRFTPIEDLALESLQREIDCLPLTADFAEWQRDIISDIPRFLLNQVHYGEWAAEQDLNEIEEIVGSAQNGLQEARSTLNDFVLQAGPAQDAALVRHFHRAYLRQCHIFAGPGASKNHLMFARMEPILNP